MNDLTEFQKINQQIRYIVKNEKMGAGELYWIALIKIRKNRNSRLNFN